MRQLLFAQAGGPLLASLLARGSPGHAVEAMHAVVAARPIMLLLHSYLKRIAFGCYAVGLARQL